MNLDFSTLYALWATDFFQKNEILLQCFQTLGFIDGHNNHNNQKQ